MLPVLDNLCPGISGVAGLVGLFLLVGLDFLEGLRPLLGLLERLRFLAGDLERLRFELLGLLSRERLRLFSVELRLASF